MHKTMLLVTQHSLWLENMSKSKTLGAFESYPNLSVYIKTTITCGMFIKRIDYEPYVDIICY